jgi:ferritin-like metal-binding protein YciE
MFAAPPVEKTFIKQLQTLYSAEEQLVSALTGLDKEVFPPQLRTGLSYHLDQNIRQLSRVDKALAQLAHMPNGVVCNDIKRLIAEGKKLVEKAHHQPALGSALINIARQVEEYEIMAYRATITRAHELGLPAVASLLETNLQEEEFTHYRLAQLAEGMLDAF